MDASPVKTLSRPYKPRSPKQQRDAAVGQEIPSHVEAPRLLEPLPRTPIELSQTQPPDFFPNRIGASLNLEPNPFEQSFGGGPTESSSETKLPSVAALASAEGLIAASNTPFNWGGGSLRTGPLSPAMVSGPTGDYYNESHHIRGGFPTPNESSMRTGLTPGGSGSMFPAPSPSTQALFTQLANSGVTPSTLDFQRTALSAAAKREHSIPSQVAQNFTLSQLSSQPGPLPIEGRLPPPALSALSQPPPQPQLQTRQRLQSTAQQLQSELGKNVSELLLTNKPKPPSGPYDPHANDAANGLFLLAQGGSGSQNQSQFAFPLDSALGQSRAIPLTATATVMGSSAGLQMTKMNGGVGLRLPGSGDLNGLDEGDSLVSDESDRPKLTARAKGKKTTEQANPGRRKADAGLGKAPSKKKVKIGAGVPVAAPTPDYGSMSDHSDDMEMDGMQNEFGSKSKLTDDEKRKNFLERNRVAALKCRQRKKQWLQNLQSKVEVYTNENDSLTQQITLLREEVVNLKSLLLAHRDCPVTQQQGLHSAYMSQLAEPFNPQVSGFGVGSGIPNQAVMAGQGRQRRFS